MSFNRFGEIICKMFSGNLSIVGKIFVSLSIIWIIFIGYLIWWNSVNSSMHDKSFRWDEWIWFGIADNLWKKMVNLLLVMNVNHANMLMMHYWRKSN